MYSACSSPGYATSKLMCDGYIQVIIDDRPEEQKSCSSSISKDPPANDDALKSKDTHTDYSYSLVVVEQTYYIYPFDHQRLAPYHTWPHGILSYI